MAKQYSKAELTEFSQEVFKANPEAKFLIATSDGNFFLPKDKQEAKHHAFKHELETFTILADPDSNLADLAEVPTDFPGDYTGLSADEVLYQVQQSLALFAQSRDPQLAAKICDMLIYGDAAFGGGQVKVAKADDSNEPAPAGGDPVASGDQANPAEEPAAPQVASGSPEAEPGEPAAPEAPAAEEQAAAEAPAATEPAVKPSTKKKSSTKEA